MRNTINPNISSNTLILIIIFWFLFSFLFYIFLKPHRGIDNSVTFKQNNNTIKIINHKKNVIDKKKEL